MVGSIQVVHRYMQKCIDLLMSQVKTQHTGTKELEIESREGKVWSLFLQGYSQEKIAKKLEVSLKTISRDFKELKTKSIEWMDTLPEGEIQLYHRKNLETIQKVIQELWGLYENTKDETKKQSLLNQIAEKSKLHSEMIARDNLFDARSFTQHELTYKKVIGCYSGQRPSHFLLETSSKNKMSQN